MPRAQSIGGKHDLHEAAGKEQPRLALQDGKQSGVMKANSFASELGDGLHLLEVAIFGAHGREDGVDGLLDEINLHRRDEIGTHNRQALGVGLAIISAKEE